MEKPKPPHPNGGHKSKNGRPRVRSLGPVVNLEDHLPRDWWNRIFNHLYLKTDGDVVGDAAITRTEVDQISGILGLSPREDRVLDLCCGQGRHTLELARRGFRTVEGIDRSHYLVQRARESARSEGLPVRFREGDARKLPYVPDNFDCVLILGNSFGYFETLQDDLKVLREVFRISKPWGKLLIDLADGDFLRQNFQKRSWEWIDGKLFVCRERSLSQDGDRLVSREVITHVEKGVVADQFYAERLYSRDGIARLLAEAGFSAVEFPAELSPDSQRNQDLGMMERRIVITAQVRKEWTPVRRASRKELKSVAVLMGDPSKPDRIKPENVFDEDDYYTIDRMKEALYGLDGYHFSFLNNHDTLITDLSRLAGRVDYAFNLCDEGYSNDPRLELHVPALLEMFNIPYTGSGPQCLAYCYDKSLVRGIAKEMGIPVPDAFFITSDNSAFELPFDFPVIVKPN
ncbi:MAG: methyltransferase domain-containing protein, partial [Candidatus Glassbacteria bacterium]